MFMCKYAEYDHKVEDLKLSNLIFSNGQVKLTAYGIESSMFQTIMYSSIPIINSNTIFDINELNFFSKSLVDLAFKDLLSSYLRLINQIDLSISRCYTIFSSNSIQSNVQFDINTLKLSSFCFDSNQQAYLDFKKAYLNFMTKFSINTSIEANSRVGLSQGFIDSEDRVMFSIESLDNSLISNYKNQDEPNIQFGYIRISNKSAVITSSPQNPKILFSFTHDQLIRCDFLEVSSKQFTNTNMLQSIQSQVLSNQEEPKCCLSFVLNLKVISQKVTICSIKPNKLDCELDIKKIVIKIKDMCNASFFDKLNNYYNSQLNKNQALNQKFTSTECQQLILSNNLPINIQYVPERNELMALLSGFETTDNSIKYHAIFRFLNDKVNDLRSISKTNSSSQMQDNICQQFVIIFTLVETLGQDFAKFLLTHNLQFQKDNLSFIGTQSMIINPLSSIATAIPLAPTQVVFKGIKDCPQTSSANNKYNLAQICGNHPQFKECMCSAFPFASACQSQYCNYNSKVYECDQSYCLQLSKTEIVNARKQLCICLDNPSSLGCICKINPTSKVCFCLKFPESQMCSYDYCDSNKEEIFCKCELNKDSEECKPTFCKQFSQDKRCKCIIDPLTDPICKKINMPNSKDISSVNQDAIFSQRAPINSQAQNQPLNQKDAIQNISSNIIDLNNSSNNVGLSGIPKSINNNSNISPYQTFPSPSPISLSSSSISTSNYGFPSSNQGQQILPGCSERDVFCKCKSEVNYNNCVCLRNPYAVICNPNYCNINPHSYECKPALVLPYSCFNSIMTQECECLIDSSSEVCFCQRSRGSNSCRLDGCNTQSQIGISDSRFCKCRKENFQNLNSYYCLPNYCSIEPAGCDYMLQSQIQNSPQQTNLPIVSANLNANQPAFPNINDQSLNQPLLSRNAKILNLYQKQLMANSQVKSTIVT